MSKRIFIIHGWDGYPEEGWFPWLKRELESRGFEVQVPAMPEAARPIIEAWVSYLAKLVGEPDEQTYFVGHSIGCQAVLRYLASIDKKIGGAVFVAGWLVRLTGDFSNEEIEIAKPWIETPINLGKVRNSSGKIVAIFSDNDEYVSAENHRLFAEKLDTKVIVERNRGHFSGSDGITELPSVLESILEMAK